MDSLNSKREKMKDMVVIPISEWLLWREIPALFLLCCGMKIVNNVLVYACGVIMATMAFQRICFSSPHDHNNTCAVMFLQSIAKNVLIGNAYKRRHGALCTSELRFFFSVEARLEKVISFQW